MLRLHEHRLLPRQTQPAEILVDGGNILGPPTIEIDILDPEQEPPIARTRRVVRDQCGERVSDVQQPVG